MAASCETRLAWLLLAPAAWLTLQRVVQQAQHEAKVGQPKVVLGGEVDKLGLVCSRGRTVHEIETWDRIKDVKLVKQPAKVGRGSFLAPFP